jgi:hypothetical protein
VRIGDDSAFGAAPPAAPAGGVPLIADPVRLAPAPLTFLNPLFKQLDTPARLVDRPVPTDFEPRVPLYVTAHVMENGRVSEAIAIEPPLKSIATAVGTAYPNWVFTPAKKGGKPVATWVTVVLDLQVSLEKGMYNGMVLTSVNPTDPLPALVPEVSGDGGFSGRYPKEVSPPDGSVSVEELDALPNPEKTPWSFKTTRTRSHVTALVEVNAGGTITRIAPTGTTEPLLVAWFRRLAPKWKLTPAIVKGRPVPAWMVLDGLLDYTVDSAKLKGARSLKKNLRANPTD